MQEGKKATHNNRVFEFFLWLFCGWLCILETTVYHSSTVVVDGDDEIRN